MWGLLLLSKAREVCCPTFPVSTVSRVQSTEIAQAELVKLLHNPLSTTKEKYRIVIFLLFYGSSDLPLRFTTHQQNGATRCLRGPR
jgi:hypothetical protein